MMISTTDLLETLVNTTPTDFSKAYDTGDAMFSKRIL